MAKLVKNYYYGKNGEKKLNCYLTHISKDVVEKSNIKDDKDIIIYAKGNKIIIENSNLSK